MAVIPAGVLRLAFDVREEFQSSGEEFTQCAYRNELARRMAVLPGVREQAFDQMVDRVAERVDKDATSRGGEAGQGELFDLRGEYHLGGGRRVSKRLSRIEHADTAMCIDDENLITVQTANLRKRQELTRLRPHWGPGVTKTEAVAAYHAHHPGENAATPTEDNW